MVIYCCIHGCKSSIRSDKENNERDISFHRFPKDTYWRLQWIEAIKRDNLGHNILPKNYDAARICCKHFITTDFFMAGMRKTVRKTKVPTIFPWTIIKIKKNNPANNLLGPIIENVTINQLEIDTVQLCEVKEEVVIVNQPEIDTVQLYEVKEEEITLKSENVIIKQPILDLEKRQVCNTDILQAHIDSNNEIEELEKEEKGEAKERKRNLLYLISNYLKEQNLPETANTLETEAQLTKNYEVCDNIDLDIILQDYQSYYFTKFNKMPKIVKKVIKDEAVVSKCKLQSQKRKKSSFTTSNEKESTCKFNVDSMNSQIAVENFQIQVKQLGTEKSSVDCNTVIEDYLQHENIFNLKDFYDSKNYTQEWKEMAEQIVKEIAPKNLSITWNDCIGMDYNIEVLKEAVIYPIRYPQFFTGLVTPWRGILLFGPPGTGKTLLAKAVACETYSTFINVRSSSLISKWRGESERMLKILFDVANFFQPTTIFIDEIDSIAGKSEDSQHDASRRFKAELLMEMDGILNGEEQVFILATTNSPWNLDPALLRRFEKRILVNVPSTGARQELFKYFFSKHTHHFQENDYEQMANLTDCFSGSDIKTVCKEVIMNLVREKLKIQCPQGNIAESQIRKPTLKDVVSAINKTSATTDNKTLEKYISWCKSYGNS